jgi:dTMP kinase
MAPQLRRGVFVTFEGGDGAGKSTQVVAAAKWLRAQGYAVTTTEEPGGTRLGEWVRGFFQELLAGGGRILPEAELFLFEAARAQHVAEVIRPALERGDVVLCDRFYDSTTAYQGYGRGLPLDRLELCHEIATGGLKPDLTFLIDVDPAQGAARVSAGGLGRRPQDSIGGEARDFHARVRRGFLEIAAREPERFVVVDGGLAAEAVSEAICSSLADFLRAAATV